MATSRRDSSGASRPPRGEGGSAAELLTAGGLEPRAVLMFLRDARLLRRGLRLLCAAIREFFLPQFQTRLAHGSRPVVVLEHPLDAGIPHRPGQVHRYLGYIPAWMSSLLRLGELYGADARGHIRGHVEEVIRLYRESGAIYKTVQSTTTRRPPTGMNPYLLAIRWLDPHLHCIPSLHVLVAGYSYLGARKTVEALGFRPGALELVRCTYAEALAVVEATLLMRQHSVIDIAPSLFMLTALFPEFTPQEARRFAGDLFRGFPVPEPVAEAMRVLVRSSYEELCSRLHGPPQRSWRQVLVAFLEAHPRLGRRRGSGRGSGRPAPVQAGICQ